LLKVSVVVISYKRSESLARCLSGLRKLIFPPFEVVVVTRKDDTATLEMLSSHPEVTVVLVSDAGPRRGEERWEESGARRHYFDD
jgi:GT2 family glycosyltransferase